MIDAHQHFWQLANPFTDWPTPDLALIHRDFLPADLAPLLADAGVTGTVLVQAAPAVEETRFILKLAERAAHVKAVVGWIDFAADGCTGPAIRAGSPSPAQGIAPDDPGRA